MKGHPEPIGLSEVIMCHLSRPSSRLRIAADQVGKKDREGFLTEEDESGSWEQDVPAISEACQEPAL